MRVKHDRERAGRRVSCRLVRPSVRGPVTDSLLEFGMSSIESLTRVLDTGIVAILRAPSSEQLTKIARALFEGGIDVIEVTFTVPGALDILAEVKKTWVRACCWGPERSSTRRRRGPPFFAGAEFIVSPAFNPDVVRLCNRYDKLAMPGAFTPTEILAAWEAGAAS